MQTIRNGTNHHRTRRRVRRYLGGIVEAEGLGDGFFRGEGVPPLHASVKSKAKMASPQSNHRQAALDDATQTYEALAGTAYET
ncbi:MAG: hypothetical protein A2Y77_06370 [Planctomycetes bacterium RBG_13_62_9]|nr:MAG: hypothetical protein A2Y77_06370 [Planctomycetes bacterium RBG_13_62_9]